MNGLFCVRRMLKCEYKSSQVSILGVTVELTPDFPLYHSYVLTAKVLLGLKILQSAAQVSALREKL
jgi:hypothetical protein